MYDKNIKQRIIIIYKTLQIINHQSEMRINIILLFSLAKYANKTKVGRRDQSWESTGKSCLRFLRLRLRLVMRSLGL